MVIEGYHIFLQFFHKMFWQGYCPYVAFDLGRIYDFYFLGDFYTVLSYLDGGVFNVDIFHAKT